MQDDAADELHVEVPHVERAAAGLADDRERLRQQIVERLAAREPVAEFLGLGAELIVGERLNLGFFRADHVHERTDLLQFAIVVRPEDLRQDDFNSACHAGRCPTRTPREAPTRGP